MNARKMFRQLGYERAPEGTYLEDIVLPYRNYKKNITIDFYLEKKTFCKARGVIDCVQINCEEMQAITQQCKELGWLEEEKQETNYEHYKDEIIENCAWALALVDGNPKCCNHTRCSECGFSTGHGCNEKLKEWLRKPYEKPTYKLSQLEYDLLNAYKNSGMRQCISNYGTLLELYKKGYFKDIGTSIPIHEILDNYEVIK